MRGSPVTSSVMAFLGGLSKRPTHETSINTSSNWISKSGNVRELLVVTSTGSRVDQSTGNSGNEQVVVDEELDGVFERLLALLEHLIELLSLGNVTRETVEDETVL